MRFSDISENERRFVLFFVWVREPLRWRATGAIAARDEPAIHGQVEAALSIARAGSPWGGAPVGVSCVGFQMARRPAAACYSGCAGYLVGVKFPGLPLPAIRWLDSVESLNH